MMCDIADRMCDATVVVFCWLNSKNKGSRRRCQFCALSRPHLHNPAELMQHLAPADLLHSSGTDDDGRIRRFQATRPILCATSNRIGARKNPWYWIIAIPNYDETRFPSWTSPQYTSCYFWPFNVTTCSRSDPWPHFSVMAFVSRWMKFIQHSLSADMVTLTHRTRPYFHGAVSTCRRPSICFGRCMIRNLIHLLQRDLRAAGLEILTELTDSPMVIIVRTCNDTTRACSALL
jgi:hypothetical protein